MVTHERWPPSDPFCSAVFTVASEYALRTMGVLASNRSAAPLTRKAIAAASLIPATDLDRVLARLTRRGFIRRTRTAKGGYSLARPASDIPLIDVIRAFQPLERIRSCPLGKPEHCDGLCPLHRRLDESIGAIIGMFGGTSLQQLVDEPLRPPAIGSANSL
ncbi:MAG: Rrf2 family transcriptional regulator [Phycisphaerales bacterium]